MMRKRKSTARVPGFSSVRLHKELDFVATEQYKFLRTNLLFTLPEGLSCPVVGVTSGARGEGKSTTSINLAYVLAEKGSRVLLIDCDLRIPAVAKAMQLSYSAGLTDLLLSREFHAEEWRSSVHENWYILPSGKIPPNPSELLASSRMQGLLEVLKEQFDYIFLDLPPVNIVSDAASVSKYIDGMILVVRENYATKKELELSLRQMQLSKIRVLGCVMNDCRDDRGIYGKRGKRYGYR